MELDKEIELGVPFSNPSLCQETGIESDGYDDNNDDNQFGIAVGM